MNRPFRCSRIRRDFGTSPVIIMFALRFHKQVSQVSELNSNASYIIVVPIAAFFKLLNQHITSPPIESYRYKCIMVELSSSNGYFNTMFNVYWIRMVGNSAWRELQTLGGMKERKNGVLVKQCELILLPLPAKMCQSHPFTVGLHWVNE